MPQPKYLLTVGEVAQVMGVHVSTIWRGSKSGRFPQPVSINGLKRWRRIDIEALTGEPIALQSEASEIA